MIFINGEKEMCTQKIWDSVPILLKSKPSHVKHKYKLNIEENKNLNLFYATEACLKSWAFHLILKTFFRLTWQPYSEMFFTNKPTEQVVRM